MADDPYVYPGTNVLRNRPGIRNAAELKRFETEITAQRMAEGLPRVPITPHGYLQLHYHIFQDMFDWAGRLRTVPISKNDQLFCLPQHLERELGKRFERIKAENGLRGTTPNQFAARTAEHISELNAIHPFREGNGRTMRAFLKVLGERTGHEVLLERIRPREWNEASIASFKEGNLTGMRLVIADALADERERKPAVIEAKLARLEAEEREADRAAQRKRDRGRELDQG